jgi:hypothetical protein
MDLSFPIPVIGKVALSTHRSHSSQISEWQHIHEKRTVDSSNSTGTTGQLRTFDLHFI